MNYVEKIRSAQNIFYSSQKRVIPALETSIDRMKTSNRRIASMDYSNEKSRERDETRSILLIGATGRTGTACLRRFSKHILRPQVHAFCRDSSKICKEIRAFCTSIIVGDITDRVDLKRALRESNASIVIVCIENGSLQKTRTASAHALVKVMKKRRFKHVRALVVSRVGAGGSRIPIGMGIGKIMTCHLQFVLNDHTGQEKAFLSLQERVTIVRPTPIKDKNATGRIQEFGEKDKVRSFRTPRDDLATWIADEVCVGIVLGRRIANITGVNRV